MSNPSPSVQKRLSARLAAVQYLYQWKLDEKLEDTESYIANYRERLAEPREVEEDGIPLTPKMPPDFSFLRKMVNGLQTEQETLRNMLYDTMEQGRAYDTVSPLIQSLLEAASYELVHHEKLTPAIILSEYTAIAAGFFDEAEVAFVNGTLQEIANIVRNKDYDPADRPQSTPKVVERKAAPKVVKKSILDDAKPTKTARRNKLTLNKQTGSGTDS